MSEMRRNAPGGARACLRAVLIGFGALAWTAAVAWQFHSAMQYEATPGERGQVTAKAAATHKPRLVLVVHPECPCTKATLTQLREIKARQGEALDVSVLVAHEDAAAKPSTNERLARAIPGIEVRTVSAESSEAMGAKTSGEAFYFDKTGALLYHGGLTEGRGVERPSAGASCLLGVCPLESKDGEVFGCPLQH